METSEVSQHEIRVFKSLSTDRWLTTKQIAEAAEVAPRTARAHALKLVRLGILDQAEVFPGYRYRLSKHAARRNRAYFDRIKRAADILGITL
jgi:DNA-binding IclR family transcriptional regulator